MKRDMAVQILQDHQTELETWGVKSLALFGSVARDEAHPGSEVDLLIEFNRPMGLFGLIEIQSRLEEILKCKLDLGTPDSLKKCYRQHLMKDCLYVTSQMGGVIPQTSQTKAD